MRDRVQAWMDRAPELGVDVECKAVGKYTSKACGSIGMVNGGAFVTLTYIGTTGKCNVMAQRYRCRQGHDFIVKWTEVA